MKTEFAQSFARDLKKIRDEALLARVAWLISEFDEAESLDKVGGVKKLAGHRGAYRVRIGDYRLGLHINGDTVEFVRFLHRKDIYRDFPG
jgi:mRNA interferase RelE/StbE